MPHPYLLKHLYCSIIYTHVFLQSRNIVAVKDDTYEHVGHNKHADYYERDVIHAVPFGAAVFGAVKGDFSEGLFLVLTLVEDSAWSHTVPHEVIPSFACGHAEEGEH